MSVLTPVKTGQTMTRYARNSLLHLILVHWQVRCSASKLGLLNKDLRVVKERFQQIFYHLWILMLVISERVWQATVTANPVPGMLTTRYSMPKQFFIMSTGTLDVHVFLCILVQCMSKLRLDTKVREHTLHSDECAVFKSELICWDFTSPETHHHWKIKFPLWDSPM